MKARIILEHMTMKTASAKRKGRKAAVELQKILLRTFPELEPDDLRVTPSGIAGEDLQLSPRAREILPYVFEVKNKEQISIWRVIDQARGHSKNLKHRPVVVFRKNRTPFHVCMEFNSFLELLKKGKENEQRAG